MRSKHNLGHYKLLTGDMGFLYPVGLVEVLPKDTFQHSTSVFLRFSPMAAPVMHPVTVRIHHFFVPHRLTWPESEGGGFESFITGGPNGDDAQLVPTVFTSGETNDLWDYFNMPTTGQVATVSALPIRAFNMIFNEWYRDEDLVAEREPTDWLVPRIAWEKDYLTTARPWPQKGPAITMPIGTTAPVVPAGPNAAPSFQTPNSSELNLLTEGPGGQAVQTQSVDSQSDVMEWFDTGLQADLTNATPPEINEFRRAFALQRFAEARARYGSRYTEYLRYLGVRSSDARQQRPEYLGGGRAKVAISEVLQTTNSEGGQPEDERFGVGDMYGHGIASMRSNAYRRTFEEHGYVLSLLSVRPKAMYLNGITRTWLRRDREEFWQKELEQIGQQEVWAGEVFSDNGIRPDHDTFGFADRYAEYKREPNRVSSEFKNVLNYWHLGRDFATPPELNSDFIECDPSKRIFNEQTQHGLWIACQHNLVARRLVSASNASRIL